MVITSKDQQHQQAFKREKQQSSEKKQESVRAAVTPLWDSFFENLELATANEHGREFVKSYGVATREWE